MEMIRRFVSAHQTPLTTAALLAIGAIAVFGSLINSATPDLAAIRAVRHAVGDEAGAIRVSGRYQFEDVDGSSSFMLQLACGTVVQHGEKRNFAVLVRKADGKSPSYAGEEIAISPGAERPQLARETQLLGACLGGATDEHRTPRTAAPPP